MAETAIVSVSSEVTKSPALRQRLRLRTMTDLEFINENKGSGTLLKNKRIGMTWRTQYLQERIAREFGWTFEGLPRSQVTFGEAITEQDSPSVTEAGWHIDRYLDMSVFPEDKFECRYLHCEYRDGSRREGIAIVVRQTSAPWVPEGYTLFAIVAEFVKAEGRWLPAQNPF